MFAKNKTLKKGKIDLLRAFKANKKEIKDIDIDRLVLTNIYPGNDIDWSKKSLSVINYRHLIWTLFSRQIYGTSELKENDIKLIPFEQWRYS